VAAVGELFPFKDYFADAPQPLFKGSSFEEVRIQVFLVLSVTLFEDVREVVG
jgi:hypothetical protein